VRHSLETHAERCELRRNEESPRYPPQCWVKGRRRPTVAFPSQASWRPGVVIAGHSRFFRGAGRQPPLLRWSPSGDLRARVQGWDPPGRSPLSGKEGSPRDPMGTKGGPPRLLLRPYANAATLRARRGPSWGEPRPRRHCPLREGIYRSQKDPKRASLEGLPWCSIRTELLRSTGTEGSRFESWRRSQNRCKSRDSMWIPA
jgi:hypothetical protein